MRIRSHLQGTKGFVVAWERLIRFRYMISDKAKKRCRILAFWERHGLDATREAFGVSRATLFRWQQALAARQGKLEGLNAKSTAPKRRRTRRIPEIVRTLIISERLMDPCLGKDKLAQLIKDDGLGTYSASTVGRMLNDLKRERGYSLIHDHCPFMERLGDTTRSSGHINQNSAVPIIRELSLKPIQW